MKFDRTPTGYMIAVTVPVASQPAPLLPKGEEESTITALDALLEGMGKSPKQLAAIKFEVKLPGQ